MFLYLNVLIIYFLTLDARGYVLQFTDKDLVEFPEEPVLVKLVSEAGQDVWRNDMKHSLTFKIYDIRERSSYYLHLQHNSHINITRPVYVMREGRIVPIAVPALKHVEYYLDVNGYAAVGVVCEHIHGGDKQLKLEGFIKRDNDTYAIYPERNSSVSTNEDGSCNHVIRKISYLKENFQTDYVASVANSNIVKAREGRRVKRQSLQTYNIELLIAVDYSVYLYWYTRISASSESARHSLTLQAIQQYYAYILNGIDLRYKNIIENDLAINVLFAGLFISDNSGDWTNGLTTPNSNQPSRPYMDSSAALDAFTSWLQSTPGLPNYDHAMAFSSNDLTKDGSTANSGLAFVSGICTYQATAVSEIYFNFQGLIVASHELGHNLGARHDGDGNACDSNNQYIMGSVSGGSSGSTALHPWHFSSCSVDYFRTKIYQLNLADINCLVFESPGYDSSALDPYLQYQPGQVYDGDTQCTYSLGNSSAVCRQVYDGSGYREICEGMYCYLPGSTSSCSRIYPSRGTSCGYNMWCIDGVCTVDSNAPPVLDTCPFGDQPGVIVNGLGCSDMVEQESYRCYAYYRACCQSCLTVQTADPNCLYGDKQSFCATLDRSQCYSNDEACCATCPAWYNPYAEPGCEYGDLWAGCVASQCPYYTESTRAYCCETCCDSCVPFTVTTPLPTTTSIINITSVWSFGPVSETTTMTSTTEDENAPNASQRRDLSLSQLILIMIGLLYSSLSHWTQ